MPNEKPTWPELSKGFCAFHQNILFWYGKPKTGKSTFGSKFPNALFLTTEDGTKHLQVREFRIKTWEEFCGRIKQIRDNINEWPVQNVIIDTVDNLADMCVHSVCRKYGFEDLQDGEWGKGYAAFTRAFKKQIDDLVALGLGVCFISHAVDKTVNADSVINPYAAAKAKPDGTVEMVMPTLMTQARKYLLGLADIILYMAVDKNQNRVIYTKPTLSFEAGDRTGRLPASLPLDYDAVVNAYYNDGDDGGRAELIGRISSAESHMVMCNIDEFQSRTRMINSRKATLETTDNYNDTDIPMSKLEALLQKFNKKIKDHASKKKENGDAVPTDKKV